MKAPMRLFQMSFEMKKMEAMKADKSLIMKMKLINSMRKRKKLFTLINTGMKRVSNGEQKGRARSQPTLRRDKKNN